MHCCLAYGDMACKSAGEKMMLNRSLPVKCPTGLLSEQFNFVVIPTKVGIQYFQGFLDPGFFAVVTFR